MNNFALKQIDKQSNFNFIQQPNYEQKPSSQQQQSIGIDFPMKNQGIQIQDIPQDVLQQDIINMPSKLQVVNVQHDMNYQQNDQYTSAGFDLKQDSQGILKQTLRQNPTQVKEYKPEDYLYGDSQHTILKQGQVKQIGQDYAKMIPSMIQARVNDTLSIKGVDLDRAKSEYNTNFELDQQINNHQLFQNQQLADYDKSETYGNKYYKRISTEHLNRTNQRAEHDGQYINQEQQFINRQKPQELKFVPNNTSDQVKQVHQRNFVQGVQYDITKYNPKQNPCLRQFLSDQMLYQSNMGREQQTAGGNILKRIFNISQNNRPQIFSRNYNNGDTRGFIKQNHNITQNNRPQIFNRTYENNQQHGMINKQKGYQFLPQFLENQACQNLYNYSSVNGPISFSDIDIQSM